MSADKVTVADIPEALPCACGGVELVRKMWCWICADCRIVRWHR